MGCASQPMMPVADHLHAMKHNPLVRDKEELEMCLQEQVDYYGDLCGEAVGVALLYTEDQSFFYGMLCGLQAVAYCIGVAPPKE